MQEKNLTPPRRKSPHQKIRVTALLNSTRGRELQRLGELGIVDIRHGKTASGAEIVEVLQ